MGRNKANVGEQAPSVFKIASRASVLAAGIVGIQHDNINNSRETMSLS